MPFSCSTKDATYSLSLTPVTHAVIFDPSQGREPRKYEGKDDDQGNHFGVFALALGLDVNRPAENFRIKVRRAQGPAASWKGQEWLICPIKPLVAMGSNDAVCGPLGMSLTSPTMLCI